MMIMQLRQKAHMMFSVMAYWSQACWTLRRKQLEKNAGGALKMNNGTQRVDFIQ